MATADTRTYATGKRKTAIARVWLKAGTGTITVNGKPADEYFERETSPHGHAAGARAHRGGRPVRRDGDVQGGGHSAQAEAMRHGISRALIVLDPEKRPVLKRAGFLTRDARKKERKKYGQPGARKRFQYSKR